ncbi:MAG: hypothetical protein Q7S66_05675 [bacterium]|nr:hypothetical protein [bacterium]
MKLDQLSRKEKEELYDKKMDQLQAIWGNPPDQGSADFSDWTDEQLEKGLRDTIGQIRFEKGLKLLKKLILFPIYAFVVLGIFGLLLFGIRQLF